ncbi:unnamed protein product [Scytosiphon promiscuus]
MGDAAEELTPPSTATPSPMPPPRDDSAPSSQYFRLESVTSLTAPVDSAIAARAAQMRSGRVPQNQIFLSTQGDGTWSSSGASAAGRRWADNGTSAEEKFPIPDNPTAWARYGFLDTSLLVQATGKSPGGRRATSSGGGAGGAEARRDRDSDRTLVKVKTDPGESWRQAKTEKESAAGGGRGGRERRHHPPAPVTAGATTNAGTSEAGAGKVERASGDSAHKVGSSTPRTDAVTPSPEERHRGGDAAAEAIGGSGSGSSRGAGGAATGASAAASNRKENGPATARGSSRGGLDSMAASMLAASAAAAAAAAEKEDEESKEEELEALRRQEAISAATTTSLEESNRNAGKNRPNPRRTQQTIAEIERHKRNRAERLRAYGCQRTLYPRIVPGGTGESGTSSPEMDTEETQTEEWVNSLRISAAIRGESLMAACTQSFAEHRAASLLGDQQLEARAARTADVSQMEGPDGLLHCAVLRGDHALAARAAQFLVDKRGSNVNSRDEWGRTPLHTAAGKGMVAMARFFIRRGANVDALDQDDRTPLFFACASGNTTMARYLTRIEVGARYDLKDKRGHLAGEYFWESVETNTRDEITAILVALGWPDPPPPPRESNGGKFRAVPRLRGRAAGRGADKQGGETGCGGRRGYRRRPSNSAPPRSNNGRGEGGGEGGVSGIGAVGGSSSSRRGGGAGETGARGRQERPKRHSEGGEAGMKRLASDMLFLMKRR